MLSAFWRYLSSWLRPTSGINNDSIQHEKLFLIMEARFRTYHQPGTGVSPVLFFIKNRAVGVNKDIDLLFNFYWIGG